VVGTYAAVLAVCSASLAIGQAAIALCGLRRWSWLAPAVGLALLCAVCWGTVRLPGHGLISATAVLLLTVGSVVYLLRRVEGVGEAVRVGAPVALLALAATSLPFIAEGHFGILGTSFNPDMSQHLLAADRLAHGEANQLLLQGYPLGPHAIVVALEKGLGIALVQGFTGLTVAVAVLASLTALIAFADQPSILRTAAALVVGLAYLVASYFAQGAFKETMQALFVLAFALSLREATINPAWQEHQLRFVPAAILAVGSVYAYSFPGLIWLVGIAAIWAVAEFVRARLAPPAGGVGAGDPRGAEARLAPSTVGEATATGPAVVRLGPNAVRSFLLAILVFFVLIAPEIGRMIDFHNFETFDPSGLGLGNLFGQISPFEALGIWPSGDFRLAPGDGAVPAIGYFFGAAFAAILLVYGLVLCWRRREIAIVSALLAVVAIYALARVAGTPYTTAKSLVIAAPIAALVIVLPLLRRPVAWLYLLAAGGCTLLALANAPIGPTSYTPSLTELRSTVGAGPTLVLVSRQLLEEEHGTPYVAWELRGGRVCIEPNDEAGGNLPPGVRFLVTEFSAGPAPFPGLRPKRVSPPYVLWETSAPIRSKSQCPLIAVRQARQGPPQG
jgi:hypothetical protein